MTVIFSKVQPGHTFPPLIQASVEDEQVRLIVRGPARTINHENGAYFEHGEVGEIELSADVAIELAESIFARFEERVAFRENSRALDAAQRHIVAGLEDGSDRKPIPEFADAERAVRFPETTVTNGDYLYEPFGEGSRVELIDKDRLKNGNRGRYIGLQRDTGDENDAHTHHIHDNIRVG